MQRWVAIRFRWIWIGSRKNENIQLKDDVLSQSAFAGYGLEEYKNIQENWAHKASQSDFAGYGLKACTKCQRSNLM